MKFKLRHIVFVLLCLTSFLYAFDIAPNDSASHSRFSIRAGLINTGMTDEYISSENYSDNYPFVSIGLAQKWSGRVNEIVISHGNTETLSNGKVKSWYEYTLLKINLLYPLNNILIKSKGPIIYLGPNISYYDYYFSHTFAMLSRYESEGSILSLGISSKILYALHPKIQIELTLSSSILSNTKKKFDYQKYPSSESDSKLTTFLETGYLDLECGVRIPVFNKFNLLAGYGLTVARIGDWDNYNSVNNLFYLEISYDF